MRHRAKPSSRPHLHVLSNPAVWGRRFQMRSPNPVIGLMLFVPILMSGQQAPGRVDLGDPPGTFSILGYDPRTGEVGAAVQSRVFSVGNGVLWAEAEVGVVATQAIVDVSYGAQALELLRKGMAPAEIVKTIWERDPDPRPGNWTKQGRQFAVMNAKG